MVREDSAATVGHHPLNHHPPAPTANDPSPALAPGLIQPAPAPSAYKTSGFNEPTTQPAAAKMDSLPPEPALPVANSLLGNEVDGQGTPAIVPHPNNQHPSVNTPLIIPLSHSHHKHKGRKSLWLLLLLAVVVGAYLAIDARLIKTSINLPFHIFKQPAPIATPVAVSTTPAQTTPAATDPYADWALYENKNLGFKFAYPKEWGEAIIATGTGEKGSSAQLSFTKQKLAVAGVVTKDFQAGADGQCYVVLGVWPNFKLPDIKSNNQEGDYKYNDSKYKGTRHILKDTDQEYIYRSFEAGSAGIGSCPGLSANGYKVFTDQSKYLGIEFFWGDGKISSGVPISEFDKYKADPTLYFSEADQENFIKLVGSASSL